MPSHVWLFAALALAISACADASTAAGSSASQCAAIETCYEGGVASMPCTVATGECPPCVLFADNSCYVQVDSSCPFGFDCSDVSSSNSSNSSSSSSAVTGTADMSASSTSAEASAASTSRTGTSSHGNDAGSAPEESVNADSDSGGSNTVLVVAILAVALVIAVLAVVLRKLFLHARAASEESQEEVPSPPATVMTASFSSNGTSLDPGIIISRSAMGTELSVTSKTSSAV